MTSKLAVPVITIDGPAGTGKGTVCHALARHLHWHCLDSGAIYRVFALAAQRLAYTSEQVQELCVLAKNLDLVFLSDVHFGHRVLLQQEDVSKLIRTENCGYWASKYGAIPELRVALLERQRQFAQLPGLVTDGRDMGTVVFPDANLKIYLTASLQERAKRRLLQLHQPENDVSLAQVVEELANRDARDSQRTVSPMQPAQDAVIVDTTDKSVDQVLNLILDLVKSLSL